MYNPKSYFICLVLSYAFFCNVETQVGDTVAIVQSTRDTGDTVQSTGDRVATVQSSGIT